MTTARPVQPPVAADVAGILAGSFSALVVLATVLADVSDRATRESTSFAERGLPPVALGLVVVSVALVPLVAFVMQGRAVPAAGIALAGIAVIVPAWAAWSWMAAPLRAGLLSTTPLAVAGTALAAGCWSADRQRRDRQLLTACLVASALAVLVHLAGYDPFEDPGCARACIAVPVLLGPIISARAAVGGQLMLTVLAAVSGGWAAIVGRSPRYLRAVATLAVGAISALLAIRWLAWGSEAAASMTILFMPVPVGVVALALLVAALATRRSRVAAVALANRLVTGSTELKVAYAIPGSDRWVDGAGRELVADGTQVIISDGSGPAFRFPVRPGDDLQPVLASLRPSTWLALSNARLSAATSARLMEVRASQRRIVAAADDEQRRIKRDLHDGAQQRIVSVLFHLHVVDLTASTEGVGLLASAEARLREVLGHLRRLDLGGLPRVLDDEGLIAALEDLVEDSAVPTRLRAAAFGAPSAEAGAAAYTAVRATLEAANESGVAGSAEIEVTRSVDDLVIRVSFEPICPIEPAMLTAAADRLGAADGRMISVMVDRKLIVEVVIPCASYSLTT